MLSSERSWSAMVFTDSQKETAERAREAYPRGHPLRHRHPDGRSGQKSTTFHHLKPNWEGRVRRPASHCTILKGQLVRLPGRSPPSFRAGRATRWLQARSRVVLMGIPGDLSTGESARCRTGRVRINACPRDKKKIRYLSHLQPSTNVSAAWMVIVQSR